MTLLVFGVVGLASATSASAASWVTPLDLSATGEDAREPEVAVGANGTTIAAWRRSNGSNDIVQASTRPAGGAFGAAVDLSAAGQDGERPQVAFAADGTATVVWQRSNGSNDIVQASTRPAGGAFGAPVDLSATGANANRPQVAFAADGTATVVWQRWNGSNDIVQASTRPAGGAFGAPVDLSAGGRDAQLPQVAVGADGTTTVVWQRSNGSNTIVQASTRPAGGAFGAPVDLSATGANAESPRVAVAADGTATAVWERWNGSNWIVQASTRPAGGAFGAPVDLSATGQNATEAQVGSASDGTTTAVWRRSNGSNHIAQASTRPAGGAFGAPVDLSATGQDTINPQVAVAADGATTGVWQRSNGSNWIVQASTRPAGGAFGAPVDLSATGQNATDPQVGFGADGTAAAVWRRSNGSNQIIQAAMATPPVVSAVPVIAGTAKVGETLTCNGGTWTDATSTSMVWLRDGAQVASGASYTPTSADAGRALTCRATATNPNGSATSTSVVVTVAAASTTQTTPSPEAAPAPKTCASRRTLRLRLARGVRRVRATALKGAAVVREQSFTSPAAVAPVSLVGLPRGTYRVRLVTATARGRATRTYVARTCRARR